MIKNTKNTVFLTCVRNNKPCCRRLALLTERSEMRKMCKAHFILLERWCLAFLQPTKN
jgi:hypothetical protein